MANLSGLTTGIPMRFAQRNYRAYGWNGRDRMRKYDGANWRNAGIVPWRATITTMALTSNVVTVTTASAHGFAATATVKIQVQNNGANYNGTFTIASVPTTTTFTYAKTATNISSASNPGYATIAPTVATSGTGLTGTYRYYAVPVNSKHYVYGSKVVSALPSAISNEIVCANQGVAISGIPATHPDPQVDKWFLYRNKNGYYDVSTEDEVQDFFKVAEIAIGTTTYADATNGTTTSATPDDALPPEYMDFRTHIPATFKYGCIFGNRLLTTGFDPITTGTANVTQNSCQVTLSSAVGDGVTGCYFQVDSTARAYVILERPSTTTIVLDRIYEDSTNTTASYSIFRDQSQVCYSEFDDFDSGGPDGEFKRNQLPVGGKGSSLKTTGIFSFAGYAWAFTLTQMWRIFGKGNPAVDGAIRVEPNPYFDGLGCVSGDAICATDNEMFWLSLRGPVKFDGTGAPQPIGEILGTDWLSSLNATQLALASAGTDGYVVKFSVPQGSDTENSLTWCYERRTGSWWKEEYTHPTCYIMDYDSNGKPALFYAQGKFIVQDEVLTSYTDGSPGGTVTGTVTTGGSSVTVFTDTNATFYTTASGLQERYVHFFNATTLALVGSRRISSNTATTITWSSSGSGGGTLTLTAGMVYHVAPIYWYWKTKNFAIPAHASRRLDLAFTFALQGESTVNSLHITEYPDNSAASTLQLCKVDENVKLHGLDTRGTEFALKMESRTTGAKLVLRDLTLTGVDEVTVK